MVRALTGCHDDGRESKEYHNWALCFSDYGVTWDTGERKVGKRRTHAALGRPANQPEYDMDGLEIAADQEEKKNVGVRLSSLDDITTGTSL